MPYREFPDWKDVVKDKHILFDSDAIISIIAFKAQDLFDELKKLNVTFTYINPVLLELRETGSEKERLERNTVLSKYGFAELAITNNESSKAELIQKSKPIGVKGNPSATDYYLGGTLARYAQSNTYLLTGNAKDFPMPLFTREAFIPLVNQTDVKALCVIGLDESKLV